MSCDLQVNFPRWIKSTVSHRGASSFQQSDQADGLVVYGGRGGGGARISWASEGLPESLQSRQRRQEALGWASRLGWGCLGRCGSGWKGGTVLGLLALRCS